VELSVEEKHPDQAIENNQFCSHFNKRWVLIC
jgi:hypothetical protein